MKAQIAGALRNQARIKGKEQDDEVHVDDEHDEGRPGNSQLGTEGFAGAHRFHDESQQRP
jgi:hypothetical protein